MDLLYLALLLQSIFVCTAQGINEPPDGKVYLAAWLQVNDSSPAVQDGDRPLLFNNRMGFGASAFGYGQNIPIAPGDFEFPVEQLYVLQDSGSTMVYLTVYARPSPWTITDAAVTALANQLAKLNTDKRKVFLRFSPEMNGNWNYYGQQPTQYVALWKRVYAAVKAVAPQTAFVWAPSSGNGYPFTLPAGADGNVTPAVPSAADLTLLDTNKDGLFNTLDDPYSPYYPGDAFVDWVGISIYHYGIAYPWVDNVVPVPGKFVSLLNLGGNFYNTYSIDHNKPFMVAETAATYHVGRPDGPGELAIKQAWWREFVTNATFLQMYPKVKMICLFEYLKMEETTFRDFRVTNNTAIREAFKADFAGVRDRYLLADVPGLVGSVNGPTIGSAGNAGKNSDVNNTPAYVAVMLLSLMAAYF